VPLCGSATIVAPWNGAPCGIRTRVTAKIRREPHWQRLAEGANLGFRRGSDTWIARLRTRDGKQQYESLGEGIDFDKAKRKAEGFFASVGNTAVRRARRGTVRDALNAYLAHLREHGREPSAVDAKWRFDLLFDGDPLADVKLHSATRDDFREWRERKRTGRLPRRTDTSAAWSPRSMSR